MWNEEAKTAGSARLPRKPRADGQRNRERLLHAAKIEFEAGGAAVSLEDIARRAGVGVGTLYRHFPTREAIIEAVYRHAVAQLADAASELLGSRPAGDALHEWLRLCVDHVAAKKVMAPALGSIVRETTALQAASRSRIIEAMFLLVDRAIASGDLRQDVEREDVLRALVALSHDSDSPEWRSSTLRLIDILMAGMRTPGTGQR